MDPRIVSVSENGAVVLWRQRGVSPTGDRYEGEVLGLYEIQEGQLRRAQMFHYDTLPLVEFLHRAATTH